MKLRRMRAPERVPRPEDLPVAMGAEQVQIILLLVVALLDLHPLEGVLEGQEDVVHMHDHAGLELREHREEEQVHVVAGATTNIKITTKGDMYLADAILKSLPKPKPKGPAHPFAEEEMWGGTGS